MAPQSLSPAKALIHTLASTHTSNRYAFFIGAGCSVSSGVRPSSALISEWRAHRFLLDADWPRLENHAEYDYEVLAEYCSEHVQNGDHNKSLREYSYVAIEPPSQAGRLREDVLTALGEGNFIDKRHWGRSMTFSDSIPTHNPKAVVFHTDEVRLFAKAFTAWLLLQAWFDTPHEYSILFESLYPLPSQRQALIEKEVEFARPYWGYLYLANMMSAGLFDVCFTTNFDDLLNDAFMAFVADKKPIVCSHDSAVSQLRLTSKRPKILKLHGDFLYDSIKNTQKELLSLERNMEDKLTQFSRELGLIVVGYSGNDFSIMTILANLLREQDCFPHGIHWCVRKNSKISGRLEDLLQYDRVLLYEIDSFDALLADFYEAFQMPEPQFSTNPILLLGHQIDRCGSFVFSEDPHPLIDRHIRQLGKNVVGLLSQGKKIEPLPNKAFDSDAG